MKMSLELSTAEVVQAIAEFAGRKIGKEGPVKVILTTSPNYDFHDRPTGTHTITATATFEEGVKP